LRQKTFKIVNDFVNEFVIRRRVPTNPVTHVAMEATAMEERKMFAVDDIVGFSARVSVER
jgi:hypothetical protein